MSEWISVRERLPEVDRYVAVVGNVGYGNFMSVARQTRKNAPYLWAENDGDDDQTGFLWSENQIAHWYPLPELPKEDDK